MVEIKINKEIKTITKDAPIKDINYEVKNIRFNKEKSTLFGTMIINKKSKDFYINFENTNKVDYNFKRYNGDYEFNDALDDFYSFHVVELSKTEKDENGNITVKKIIKIK